MKNTVLACRALTSLRKAAFADGDSATQYSALTAVAGPAPGQ